ncbi:MAG TPA: hypothetical protein VNA11_01780, partial [Pseudonocardia sp.]|nr:hypothetical protein [Pseudonocardia sp.]
MPAVMFVTSSGRSVLAAARRRGVVSDLLTTLLLVTAGWAIAALAGVTDSGRPLAGVSALGAAMMLVLVAPAGEVRRAQSIAGAIGPPAACFLLPP